MKQTSTKRNDKQNRASGRIHFIKKITYHKESKKTQRKDIFAAQKSVLKMY